MQIEFSAINLKDKDAYYQIWEQTPKHSLDYTLPNIFGWQRYFGLEWSINEKILFLKQTKFEEVFWVPLGAWEELDWEKILTELSPHPKTFIRVPEQLLKIWQEALPSKLTVFEDRGQWEYLYNQSDLADLPGSKFHKKKNHYSCFVKTYGEPQYHELNNTLVEDVLALQDEWCQWHECSDSSSLQAENEAINQVLAHWNQFKDLCGGALYVDDHIVAFSLGEKLDDEYLGVHYEKGLNGYKGIYQTINREFAKRASNFKFLNRAQDLDEEGLRQAKMSYHPVDFLKKYRCVIS